MMFAKDFSGVRRAGRRKARFLGLKRKSGYLLSLHDLTSAVKPGGEHYLGVQEIKVSRIIGTEDRGNDFAEGFLPLRNSMEHRWTKVRDLLLGPGISEAIRAIEYGGYYFVRDGNHRVSVAKCHGIEYLDAEVTRYDVPVKLPLNMSAAKIPSFAAKAAFQETTRLFDYVPEGELGSAHPESWHYLADRLLPNFRRRLTSRYDHEPEDGEFERQWYESTFLPLIAIIRRQALPALFPNRYDLDIMCDLIKHLRNDTEDITPAESFENYIAWYRRRHMFRRIAHNAARRVGRISSNQQQEYDHFLRVTRLLTFCPEAEVARGRADWYRYLTRQVVVTHAGTMMQETGRMPYRDDLIRSWYHDLYLPTYELYGRAEISVPFPVFYRLFMKYRQRQTIRSVRRAGYAKSTSIETSFENFLKTRPFRSE